MTEGILTAAEIAEIERLDAARTPGGWTARGGSVDVDGLYEILVLDEDLDDPDPDAAFIAACSTAVPKLLETIRAYQEVLPAAHILRDVAQFMILNGGCVSEIDDLMDWADRIEALEKQLLEANDEQT